MTQDATDQALQVFEIRPQMVSKGKQSTRLAQTDLISATVQVVASGGETNLHAHMGNDAVWIVLDGEASFYGEGDRLTARLQRHQGLVMPRGTPYWFESTGSTPLVILRIGASAKDVENKRVDFTQRKPRQLEVVEGAHFKG